MGMATMSRRLQILIDEERYLRLSELASARGVSVATIVREAVDRAYGSVAERRLAAATTLLSAPPHDVGTVNDLRQEILGAHEPRASE